MSIGMLLVCCDGKHQPRAYYEREKASSSNEEKRGKWAHVFFLQIENWTLASVSGMRSERSRTFQGCVICCLWSFLTLFYLYTWFCCNGSTNETNKKHKDLNDPLLL